MGASASREKFSESVSALIEQDVSPDNAEFWDELWKIPSSVEEVFELISPEAARMLRDEKFDNLATLFTQAIAQLCQIVETPYSIYFDQALNCVRVLTRILPFLLEKGDLGESDENVEDLCWATGETDDSESMLGKVVGGESFSAESEDESDDQEPLALLVIHATMHMLFLPQFTCEFFEQNNEADFDAESHGEKLNSSVVIKPSASKTMSKLKPTSILRSNQKTSQKAATGDLKDLEKKLEEAMILNEEETNAFMQKEAGLRKTKYVEEGILLLPRPTSIVWAGGIGVKPNKVNDTNIHKFDKNRVEVLRLLLATCCDPLFSPGHEYNPLASRWLGVATAADSPNAICLFYSLFNTVISFDPKSSLFTNDTHAKLVSLSAQVLCVLLDCGLPGGPEPVKNGNEEPVVQFEKASKTGFNIFRTIIARIDSRKELTIIYKGLTKLLCHVHESKNAMGIGSKKTLQCYQEVLIIFWKILDENPLFMNHILLECDVTEIVVPICYIMYANRKDPSQTGLLHICTFLLLKLSGERSFGVGLNKKFDTKLPCNIPIFSGGHADLISITLHKLVTNGSFKLVPLYSCFFTIICNISPYWRSISLVAAVKLVNLFEILSSPKFLFSEHKAYNHLALLLEVFNNIIQYQYHGSQHLVYAIIRRKDIIGRLSLLDLKTARGLCSKAYGRKVKKAIRKKNMLNRMKEVDERNDYNSDEGSVDSKGNQTGPSYFIPTEEWLEEFEEKMPLETIKRLLQHLTPVIDEVIHREEGIIDESEILSVLNNVTMVGLLPVPHAIVIRKYQPNQYTALWFTAYLWGIIFTGNQSLPIFDGEAIELFQVSVGEDDESE